MTQIQSHPVERWTASRCALYKRVGRSFTFDFTAEGLDGLALNDPLAELGGHLLSIIWVKI